MEKHILNTNGSEPSFYTVKEFARLFKGKDSNWVRRMIAQGKIKATKQYGEILVPSSELEVILSTAERKA